MSWVAILVLAAGSYGFKAAGFLGVARVPRRPWMDAVGALVAPALLSALVVVQTVADGTTLVIDARLAGVLAGGYAVWRQWPFVVVVLVAAVTAATIRALA